jgi:mono/diheme cytochrome c family protein
VIGRHTVPVAGGLLAAAVAFAAVGLATAGVDGHDRDRGGREPPASHAVPPAAPPAASAARGDGRAVFVRMGCGSCHTLAAAGSRGEIGPDLDTRLAAHTRESLIAKIVSPGSYSVMPDNFGERMSDAELAALVDFLLEARRAR